jgi:hypothetical protein
MRGKKLVARAGLRNGAVFKPSEKTERRERKETKT